VGAGAMVEEDIRFNVVGEWKLKVVAVFADGGGAVFSAKTTVLFILQKRKSHYLLKAMVNRDRVWTTSIPRGRMNPPRGMFHFEDPSVADLHWPRRDNARVSPHHSPLFLTLGMVRRRAGEDGFCSCIGGTRTCNSSWTTAALSF
jgi:hypothetical protein